MLGVPLAGSYSELQDLPSLLVGDAMIVAAAIDEVREWEELQRKGKNLLANRRDEATTFADQRPDVPLATELGEEG